MDGSRSPSCPQVVVTASVGACTPVVVQQSEGPRGYRGEVAVFGLDGGSQVWIRITAAADDRQLQHALDQTVSATKSNVEAAAQA